MPNKKRTIFTKILIWRYKYISERQFILVLSVLVGFLAGLGTVLLKYLTLFIQSVLEGGFHKKLLLLLVFYFSNCRGLACLLNQKKRFKKRNWSWNFYHAVCYF